MSEGSAKNLAVMAVLILVLSVVVLTTLAIIGGYSEFLRVATTVDRNESTDITAINNQSSVSVGTTSQFPFLTNLDGCFQSTNSSLTLTKTTDYTFSKGGSTGGTVLLTATGAVSNNGTNLNCSTISYKADSSSQASADQFSTGVAIFGSFVAILVLGIVGKAIIGLFTRKKD